MEQYNSNSQNSSENNTDYSPAFYWFPLAKIKKNIPVISFDFEYFDDENKMNLLKNIFISHKIKKVSATLFLTKDIGLYRIFRKAFPKSKDLKLFNTTDFDEANDYEKWLKYHV